MTFKERLWLIAKYAEKIQKNCDIAAIDYVYRDLLIEDAKRLSELVINMEAA